MKGESFTSPDKGTLTDHPEKADKSLAKAQRIRTRCLLFALVVLAAAALGWWLTCRELLRLDAYRRYQREPHEGPAYSARARVESIEGNRATLRLLDGKYRGKVISASMPEQYSPLLAKGDKCLVRVSITKEAKLCGKLLSPLREKRLIAVGYIVLALIVLVMGRRGLRIILSVTVAAFLVIGVLLPLSLRGLSPLLLSVPIAAVITSTGILIIGGRSRKSLNAIIGSVLAFFGAMWLPLIFSRALSFSGIDLQFGTHFHLFTALWYSPDLARVDFSELFLAGIILSGLGAVMDVAMVVSTAMAEVKNLRPDISPAAEIRSGLAVGKDVFGMMAVTVLLIFAGSNFEMLLLLHMKGFPGPSTLLLNYEDIAGEIARVLTAILGLALVIPFTAFAAGLRGRR